ncbi:MAG: hypothetical protein HPY66_1071 [Firmicutes bacterium]|nr:hypothetical protein [Bacillota bacterium]MDI6706901.1 ECF transporter S component [Bacillota bacterium]
MKGIRFITRTALLLALTVVFQMMRPFIPLSPLGSNFIIGSLVNASLATASVMVGMWGGIIISVAAPVIAFMQQHIAFVWLVPIVAGGNAALVLLYGWWYRKNKWTGIALSSVVKFVLLFAMVKTAVSVLVVPPPAAAMLTLMFSWPQLVTAVIGGIIAVPVIERLKDWSGNN